MECTGAVDHRVRVQSLQVPPSPSSQTRNVDPPAASVSPAMRLAYRRLPHRRVIFWALLLSVAITAIHHLWIDLRTIDFDFDFGFAAPAVDHDPSGTWSEHPVVTLHQRAEKAFDAFLRRQSGTVDAAEAEYTRRYARKPPPGFRQWAEYALAHGSPVIDDFDTIADGVHRYHNLTAAEIQHRMHRAVAGVAESVYDARVASCRLLGGAFGDGCRHFAQPLSTLLGSAAALVPDVGFLINFLDEPSVLPGPQDSEDAGDPSWEDLSHQPLADTLAEACRVRGHLWSHLARNSARPVERHGLPFVYDIASSKNVCEHPEYSSQHGFLIGPPTMMRMKTDVPILSQAAPYPFGDILYPSTHYGLRSSLYKQS